VTQGASPVPKIDFNPKHPGQKCDAGIQKIGSNPKHPGQKCHNVAVQKNLSNLKHPGQV